MINKQYKFIEPYDDTARLLNEKGNQLYHRLKALDLSKADIDEFGKTYFNNHHRGRRLFFSIQSSADIIYRAQKLNDKKLQETSFLDYGAGLGTLFLLAGMVGFKKVYYNDYFPLWADYAKIVCNALNVKIDNYIVGDIDAVITFASANQISIDIIASRNVVEHIYNLRAFYQKLYKSGITNICYATTTANYHNLAMRLKHYWYHHKKEKALYIQQRRAYIKELTPLIGESDLNKLVKLTRGRAFNDFTEAVSLYLQKQTIPVVEFLSTNTCDCHTGVWAENMIAKKNYFDIINKAGFSPNYSAGFWDTHYKYSLINFITRIFNRMIHIAGNSGIWLSPFVHVVATKKQS